ncbi:ATP-binding protein [Streptomyces clavuligerus]|nr:ATP-binding protein [Streptomyces clavuligerus]EDY51622.1 conserved hypothetical protein [Streptomyces clavuligerus]MBY6305121.1 ATP-binding protein [Streptomyces clavuligerus]QCS09420.1 ATP-binding protein [Streptomyces clavuligerus]QPJ96622.1 ATP-binding protein [Streptomyces clavuligerus]
MDRCRPQRLDTVAVAVPPQPGIQRAEVSFRPDPKCVSRLRALSADLLNLSGVLDGDVIDTVQLLVSEIATNALTHGNGKCVTFRLECDPIGFIRIEVDDHSNPAAGTPAVRCAGPEDENGRGMRLVTVLSRDWGREGTCTWCTVPSVSQTREFLR